MRKLSGFVVALLVSLAIYAQDQDQHIANLTFYADVMVNASLPENRMRASDEFNVLFKTYISRSESVTESFKQLPWLSVITPQDSAFRVITWQVEEIDTYRYYGYIQIHTEGSTSVIQIHDTRSLNSEFATYNPDTWYGALYYGIQHFVTSDMRDAYMLLGFNAYTKQINQRVADVLTLRDQTATFGLPVFFENDSSEVKSRILLEYADAASSTMRFDREKELLIYDHVIPINTPEGPALVPDGSYHGYGYKKGIWYFIDSVFNVTSEEPPGGRPNESVKRDLFGRAEKKE